VAAARLSTKHGGMKECMEPEMAVSPGLPVITTLSQFPVTGGTGMPYAVHGGAE
jgi:hypothetical protein